MKLLNPLLDKVISTVQQVKKAVPDNQQLSQSVDDSVTAIRKQFEDFPRDIAKPLESDGPYVKILKEGIKDIEPKPREEPMSDDDALESELFRFLLAKTINEQQMLPCKLAEAIESTPHVIASMLSGFVIPTGSTVQRITNALKQAS